MIKIKGTLAQLDTSGGLAFVIVRTGASGNPRQETLNRHANVDLFWEYLIPANEPLLDEARILALVNSNWSDYGELSPSVGESILANTALNHTLWSDYGPLIPELVEELLREIEIKSLNWSYEGALTPEMRDELSTSALIRSVDWLEVT